MQYLSILVEVGNIVVMVEYNMQVVGVCDYIIDMGLGVGDEGGEIVVEGRLEEVVKVQ